MNKLITIAAVALWAALPLQAHAAGDHGKKDAPGAASEMTDGEIRKVDAEGAKLTVRHAEIKSLDMPAMTMVFNVRDKALLGTVKAGDKVKFKAVNEAGKFTITEMQVTK
jgi:Cu(I)/Ag(I) efflux system periplasmic protein CusF